MTDNIIDMEQHFIDEQRYNQRIKLSDDEITHAIKLQIATEIRKAMEHFEHRVKGFHIQVYGDVMTKDGMVSNIYIVQNLAHIPHVDPTLEAEIYCDDDA